MKTIKILFLFVGMLVSVTVSAQDYVWAKRMGGIFGDSGNSIAVDASGNVYTTGYFEGTVDFDPGAGIANLTSSGVADIFVSKLDVLGNLVWAKKMGTNSNDIGFGLAVDDNGNVYTTGYFQGTADFDPGAGTAYLTSAGNADIFITKLDASGNFVWAKRMGGSNSDIGFGLAVDDNGNVYTTGSFQGTADFDPGAGTANLTSAGNADIFISKLDASGNFVWAKSIGGASWDVGYSISVDASGNVYTTGYFLGIVDFDPGTGTDNLTSVGGSRDIFVSKLDAAGNFVWSKNMGGTSLDVGYSITVDASGNVYTTGSFDSTADFDPGAGTTNLTSAGSFDIFVTKLDASGNLVWAKSMGGTSIDEGKSIAVDASGNVYITGYFSGIIDFDPGTGTANLTSVGGSRDIFVSKLDAAGNLVWAKRMGGSNSDIGYSITVDASGNVYTTGSFEDTVDFDPGAGTANLTSAGSGDIFVSKLTSSSLGLDEITSPTIFIYPNPVTDFVQISSEQSIKTIEVYDDLGRLTNTSFQNQRVDVSKLSSGVYFLKITDENGAVLTYKILKK